MCDNNCSWGAITWWTPYSLNGRASFPLLRRPVSLFIDSLLKTLMAQILIPRCANCGYVCTLPHGIFYSLNLLKSLSVVCSGHSQREHSTSHGSMSKTKWAVDGPSGTIFELDGHISGRMMMVHRCSAIYSAAIWGAMLTLIIVDPLTRNHVMKKERVI